MGGGHAGSRMETGGGHSGIDGGLSASLNSRPRTYYKILYYIILGGLLFYYVVFSCTRETGTAAQVEASPRGLTQVEGAAPAVKREDPGSQPGRRHVLRVVGKSDVERAALRGHCAEHGAQTNDGGRHGTACPVSSWGWTRWITLQPATGACRLWTGRLPSSRPPVVFTLLPVSHLLPQTPPGCAPGQTQPRAPAQVVGAITP